MTRILHSHSPHLSAESEILKLEFSADTKLNWSRLSVSSIKAMKWVKAALKSGSIMPATVKHHD